MTLSILSRKLSPALQDDLSKALGMPTRQRRPIHSPFSLAMPQIKAPQRIAPAMLQPFVEQRKPLSLVHPAFTSLPALLTAFDEHALQATVREATRLLPLIGQRLLVVFPVQLQQPYVLPTRLDAVEVEAGRVMLTYQDLRHERRYRVPSMGPLSMQLAPASVLTTIEPHQIRVTRALSWRPGVASNTLEGELVDGVETEPPATRRSVVDIVSARPTWQGQLHDLSRGGAGVLLPLDLGGQAAVHHVVLLRLRLPPVRLAATPERVALTLRVLGTVRAMRTLLTQVALHIRFLDRLPEAFAGLFEQLEREWHPPA